MDPGDRNKRLKSEDGLSRADQQARLPQPAETTLFISNLHCPSCVNSIEQSLFALRPRPLAVSPSIVSHSVVVSHYSTLPLPNIVDALEKSGFDIHSAFQDDERGEPHQVLSPGHQDGEWEDSLEQAIKRWRQTWRLSKGKGKDVLQLQQQSDMGKRLRHAEQCPECQTELTGQLTDAPPKVDFESTANLRDTLWPVFSGEPYGVQSNTDLKSFYDVELGEVKDKNISRTTNSSGADEKLEIVVDLGQGSGAWRAELSIVGMTCSACVGSITGILEGLSWVTSANVALLTNSATVVFEGKQHAEELVQALEDAGFDASVERLEKVESQTQISAHPKKQHDTWKATYTIGGMTCSACVGSVTEIIEQIEWVEQVDVNLISNTATVVFTGKDHLSGIAKAIEAAGFEANLDNVVNVAAIDAADTTARVLSIRIDGMYCHHCPAKVMTTLHTTFAGDVQVEKVPTLKDPILRIRYTAHSPDFTARSILAALSGADPALTPRVYHPPTIEDKSRELQARERRRILIRLALSLSAAVPAFIIGVVCMSLLDRNDPARRYMMEPMWAGSVSRAEWALFILATPVYFFAADTFHRKAIKELQILWRPGSRTKVLHRFTRFGSMNMLMSLGTTIAYFSSVAELAIAATEKPQPAMDDGKVDNSFYFDSVVFLTMFLLIGRFLEAYSKAKTGDAVSQLGQLRPLEALLVEKSGQAAQTVSVDLLDVGDTVFITHGASPPFDGVIVEGYTTFDESSLTGESKLVEKLAGDTVFSGTVNKGGPISIRLTSVSGTSLLDQIIKVVREGQTRRAPVERAADIITSHFVPFVVTVGILTWVIWLALGESATLPSDWLDASMGGWALWSLRFAIAVFVVACPCGIGLAAPTALFVGGGIAAKHGILAKGGGEAFQEASALDCIVFDKTGTLTEGGEPVVTDYGPCSDDDESQILGMILAVEQQSSHPIAGAVVGFCQEKGAQPLETLHVEETAGMGMKGRTKIDIGSGGSIEVECLIGNERLMAKRDVDIHASAQAKLESWKQSGKSVVLVALRAWDGSATKSQDTVDPTMQCWTLSAIFAVADAIRPEAASTVSAMQNRGVDVWMLSGDNLTTAQAVAAQVGIRPENVIAEVLPDQKADKIQYLQKSLPYSGRGKKRATVAMVGDGINDSPALTMADVGIAIGSGSDVAISSAEFVLISSNLTSLLTLVDLSRAVFRRVWFNFGWALVYNVIAMPVAAGVFYPIKSGSGTHVRLDPVWASLAMALSSVSVVTSSLLLRSRLPLVGFREAKDRGRPSHR